MKKFLLAVAMVLATVVPASAQPQATPTQRIAFDYAVADLTTFAVVRFEVKWDAGAFTSINIPPPVSTANGVAVYAVDFPPLTPGQHSFEARACNATACSEPSPTFVFTLVVVPPVPGGVRIIAGGAPEPEPQYEF